MGATIPGWSPEIERGFKEILFRFLEEIQCTRAALYLYGPGDLFLLATQYGFGRRDPLAIEHRVKDPMVARVRELRGVPVAYNHRNELGPLAEYIKTAGNSRLLLVPLIVGDEIIGFVDARDKGRKQSFERPDISKAGKIAAAMVDFARRSGFVIADEELVPVPEPRVSKPRPAPVGETRPPLLDESGLENLHDAALDCLLDNQVSAVAATLTTPEGAATLINTRAGGAEIDREAFANTQVGMIPIQETAYWQTLGPDTRWEISRRSAAFLLSNFLHGEQGALLATAQIVDTVPWYEGKQYGATQVMDEARHVEVYRRFVQEKLQHEYPVNPELKKLLDLILSDSRWDFKFLGMQIMVEGLALAAFGTMRDTTNNALLRDLTAAVMEDESRHVAFGVLSLREHLANMDERGRVEREDFVYEAAVLMRDRLTNREVWETMGLDADRCVAIALASPLSTEFRRRLFSKIVPNVKSLGLLSNRQRARFAALGVLEFEHGTTSDEDQESEEAGRSLPN